MDAEHYFRLQEIFGQEKLEEIEDQLLNRSAIFAEVYMKYNPGNLPQNMPPAQFRNRLAIQHFNGQFQQFFDSISRQAKGLTPEEAREKIEVHFPSLEQSRQEAELAELERLTFSSPILPAAPERAQLYSNHLSN
jgi:hypothetical protein